MKDILKRYYHNPTSDDSNPSDNPFTVCILCHALKLWSMAGVVTRHLDSAPSFEVTFWRSVFNTLALAVALTTVANVLIVMTLGPLITALFARLFLQHRLGATTWLAIAVAGLGIVWMFLHGEDATFSIT